jgi:hypothetical protein
MSGLTYGLIETHLHYWAQELEATHHPTDAQYVRERLLALVQQDTEEMRVSANAALRDYINREGEVA